MHLHKYLNINLNTDVLLFNRCLTVTYANQKLAFISVLNVSKMPWYITQELQLVNNSLHKY